MIPVAPVAAVMFDVSFARHGEELRALIGFICDTTGSVTVVEVMLMEFPYSSRLRNDVLGPSFRACTRCFQPKRSNQGSHDKLFTYPAVDE